MQFKRQIDTRLVSALNALYADKDSWWRALVDDEDVFVAIRPNAINAYAHGASIAKIEWNGRPCLSVHRKYLVVPQTTKGDEYVDLLDDNHSPTKPLVVEDWETYSKNLKYIKAAARQLGGKEREDENKIATNCSSVLDMEVAFNDSQAEVSDRKNVKGRVDIVALTSSGVLTLTEAKLHENSDLRRADNDMDENNVPEVCNQLTRYADWAAAHEDKILAAYTSVAEFRKALGVRSAGAAVTRLDLTPRLLILGFDNTKKKKLGDLRKSIVDGVKKRIPTFTERHIRAVGNASNVRDAHLE